MDNSPFFILKDQGGVALPAVITTPADGNIAADVLYEHIPADPTLGMENAQAYVHIQSSAIAGKTITNSGNKTGATTVKVDELWEDDNFEPVTDENDIPVYATAQYVHNVKTKSADAEGIMRLELTKD